MKRSLLLLTLLLLCAMPVLAAETKLGFIDLQKALNTCEAGKSAKEKISAKVKEYEVQIDQKKKDLKKLDEELKKQAMLLAADTRAAKERDFQQKDKDLQRFVKDIQEELQQKDNDFTKQIIEDLSKIINDLGTKEGYTMILEKTESAVLFAEPTVDLTDKVIKAYDASRKK
jgi:outer membrane protein